ncbi:hypothetical protein NLI96_g7249 [Meripilus lineatus]|uniref:BZIP domain-containing protein n=1 Tax=Meripilus lineatus TaxID=2056292 RepID=A0AAD5V495_9APHY|nr:hypothetical protein NLI96_g7249 [Physisporinus lineatus]
MSSKRGRKRNDNLPPNRARDVQRAFRARRAAHLEALEQRVAELEEENETLRAALHLPPANRPALGKGPTGKDKPKPYAPRSSLPTLESIATASGVSTSALPIHRTDSPSSASTRTHSLSPSALGTSLNASSHSMPQLDTSWDDQIMLRKERSDSQASPVSSGYPIGTTQQTSYSYPPPSAPPSRQSAITQIYMQPAPQNYQHQTERQAGGNNYQENFIDRRYSFSQSAFPSTHDTSMHSHSPTSSVPPSTPQRGNPNNVQQGLSYPPPRRSITESQGYRQPVLNQQQLPPLPHVQQQSAHVVRISSPVGLQEGVTSLRADYDMESRVGRMS